MSDEEINVKSPNETGPRPVLRAEHINLAKLAPPMETGSEGTQLTTSTADAERKPLVTGIWAGVLGTLATLSGVGAGLMGHPISGILACVSILLALVVGTSVKVPAFAVGKPYVSGALAVPLAGLAGHLVQQAETLPEGWARGGMLLGAVVLSFLAGVPLPTLRK